MRFSCHGISAIATDEMSSLGGCIKFSSKTYVFLGANMMIAMPASATAEPTISPSGGPDTIDQPEPNNGDEI